MPRDQKRDYEAGYRKPPPHPFHERSVRQSARPVNRTQEPEELLSDALNEFVLVTENDGVSQDHQAPGDHHPTRQPLGLPLFARSGSFSTWAGISKARSSRHLPRPPPSGRLLESGKVMIENLTREQYDTVLRQGFVSFAARCFHDLKGNPLGCAPASGRPRGPGLPAGHRRPAKPI
jgi:hypothetical protein